MIGNGYYETFAYPPTFRDLGKNGRLEGKNRESGGKNGNQRPGWQNKKRGLMEIFYADGEKGIFRGKSLKTLDKLQINLLYSSLKYIFPKGIEMGYKRLDNSMTFADISLAKSMSSNRSLKRLEKIEKVINWDRLNAVMLSHYEVGNSPAGADAYPSLMLLKGILLQKWYKIDSDPELENQINDRISFKKFLGISMEMVSPDHSTFSRFKGRLSSDAMRIINNEVL